MPKSNKTNLAKSLLITFVALVFATYVVAEESNTTKEFCELVELAGKDAEKIRQLNFKKPVPCLVHSKEQIRAYILNVIDQEIPPERIEHEEFIYKTLGLIAFDQNYKKLVVDLYTSQIGGYYDPVKKHFIMADWIAKELQYHVAVHELTHALQDQHYNLKQFTDTATLTTDQLLARAALVEGDATLVMLKYSSSDVNLLDLDQESDLILDQGAVAANISEQGINANQALLQIMIFPYVAGLKFAQHLAVDDSQQRLDLAFKKPPLGTRYILHPDLYLQNETATKKFIDADFALEKNQKIVFRDVLGEFFIRVWLENLAVKSQPAAKLAARSIGDAIIVIKDQKQRSILKWLIAWDTKQAVQDFERTVKRSEFVKKHLDIKCEELFCSVGMER